MASILAKHCQLSLPRILLMDYSIFSNRPKPILYSKDFMLMQFPIYFIVNFWA